jgi:catechol 2,3-dioxygenase-like lactoylglutathione lyase family enzyme
MKFSGICLITPDVAALAVFYARVLDCAPLGDDTHSEFRFGNAGMAIYSIAGMEELAPGSMTGAGYGSFTIVIEVEDIQAEYRRIQQLGVPLLKPLQRHPWGATSFWFRDPDGNIVDFVHSAN